MEEGISKYLKVADSSTLYPQAASNLPLWKKGHRAVLITHKRFE